MTDAIPRPPSNPFAPEVLLPPAVQTSAGFAVSVPVQIRHRGRVPARMRITVLGLDSRWAPEPLELGPMEPGEAAQVTLTLVPERGALGARYPFVVAVESTAVRGQDGPIMGLAESTLAVDSQERISMTIQPPTPTAVFGKKFRVQITNPGSRDRAFTLIGDAASGASVSLQQDQVEVPAQRTVSVKGRVRIRRPTFFGGENTHAFAVTAQGVGAPEFAEATVRSTPLIGRGPRMVVGLVLVVALWASLAIVFIPKISDAFKPKSVVGAPSTVTSQGPAASTGGAAPGQSGTEGSSGAGGNGNGGNGPGGSGGGSGGQGGGSGNGEGSGGGAQQAGYQLTGTVTGAEPKGVTVTLAPTSLVGASDAGAQAAPGSSQSTGNAFRAATSGALGKIPAEALQIVRDGDGADNTTTVLTNAGGEFGFAGITAPGYYLLTVSKTGFQTQKFLINSADLASPQPLKIAMVPGAGKLSGTVTDPDGAPIGAATVIVTDGTVTVQTSSVSASAQGTPGTWTADNLSTPGTYLVTVTAPGYGGASSLITLGPKGTATADLSLVPGQGSIVGTVTGQDGLGQFGGLGGISVTATDGDVTRTATTVTSQALRGTFILPNMPTPGEYTMTISGDGFLTQTRTVTIAEGVGSATVNATLSRADGVVEGTVKGVDAAGRSEGGLVGVGLTLTSSTTTLKTMTTSGDQAGTFRFTGVPPGTYVLTASQYGRTPSSATVEIKASETAESTLVLKASTSTALPETSRIRGVVVDARSQGPLTCDRQLVPDAQKCVITVSTQVPVLDSSGRTDSSTKTVTATALPADPSYLLPAMEGDAPGLAPGLYVVTISAPGYEPATARVQVGQDQTVQAPQVALQPLAVVAGTVTYKTGTPAAGNPTCVEVVPAGAIPPNPADVTHDELGCGTDRSDVFVGTVQPDGSYQVRGLTHGSYQVAVMPTDREFLPTSPSAMLISPGTDGRLDAALDRLGRLQITALVPDPATGALGPAPEGTSITVTAKSGALRPLDGSQTTGPSGAVTVRGLQTSPAGRPAGAPGKYTITATATGSTGTLDVTEIGLDQTVPVTVVLLADNRFAVVGRMTTIFDGAPVPAVGVDVAVTGTVGFDGQTPLLATATVTTDTNGCFAIIPAGWPATGGPDLKGGDCPAVTDPDAISKMPGENTSLVLRSITVAVAADDQVQQLNATAVMISPSGQVRTIPSTALAAQPSPFGSHVLSTLQPVGGYQPVLSQAVVRVTKQPASAGAVTVTVNSDGSILWQDASLPANLVVAGNYTVAVSLPGYVSVVAKLSCPLGKQCVMQDASGTQAPISLRQLPSITGSISIQAPLPGGISVADLASTTATLSSGPAGIGSVTVTLGAAQQVFDENNNLIAYRMKVTYRDASEPAEGLALPSVPAGAPAGTPAVPYRFAITLPGYSISAAKVTCGQNFADTTYGPGGCSPFDVTLNALPVFSPNIVSDPTGSNVAGASIQVTTVPSGTGAVTVTWDGTQWVWQQQGLPVGMVAPGTYTVVGALAGFDQASSQTFTCQADSVTCQLTVVFAQRTNLTLVFQGQGGSAVNSVRTTFSGTGVTSGTVVTTGNTVTYPGLISLQSASFKVHAQAGGHAFLDYDSGSSDSVSCTGSKGTQTGLHTQPGPSTTCTITLTPVGSVPIVGTGCLTRDDSTQSCDNKPSMSITLTCATPNPDATYPCPAGTDFSGTTNGSGAVTITGSNTIQGLGAGIFDVSASLPGYDTVTGSIVITDSYQLMGPPDPDPGITVVGTGAGASLRIDLQVKTVSVDLQVFASTGGAFLPNGTFTLTSSNNSYACVISGTSTPACQVDTGGPFDPNGPFVQYTGVNPGAYTINATPTDHPSFIGTFQTGVIVQPATSSDLQEQAFQIFIVLLASSQTINITQGGVAFDGSATVSLVDPITGTTINDLDGNPLTQDDVTTGTVTFSGIPNGTYFLHVTASGYQPIAWSVGFAAYNNPRPADITVPLTRAARNLSLTLRSSAKVNGGQGDGEVDFSSATVTLVQTDNPTGGALDGDQTASSNGGGTFTFNQIPTGTWHAVVTSHSSTASFSLPDPEDPDDQSFFPHSKDFQVPDPGFASAGQVDTSTVSTSAVLQEGAATLTLNWTTSGCGTAPTGTVPVTITRDDGTDTTTATISATVPGTSAVATVLLPLPADGVSYSWVPTLDDTWQAPDPADITFTAPTQVTAGSVTMATSTIDLSGNKGVFNATLTVDGNPYANATISATATGQDPISGTTDGDGKAKLCLPSSASGINWTVSANNTAADVPIINLATVAVKAQNNKSTPASTTFVGYTITPHVAPTSVPGRPTSDVVANLVLKASTTTVWPTGAATWDQTVPSDTGGDGPKVIVKAGTYTVTATPAGGVFGADTSSATDVTDSPPTTLTASLPYLKTSVSITVEDDTHAAVSGATVSLDPADGQSAPTPAVTDTNGAVGWYDLDPTTDYTATATWTDASSTEHTGVALFITGAQGTDQDVTITLDEVDVPVTVTVDGENKVGAIVTASKGTTSVTGTTDGNGTAMLRLAPGTGWTFSMIKGNTVLVDSNVTVAADGTTTADLTGTTVTVTIRQQAVTGRPADATESTIDLALCPGTTTCTEPLWSGSVDLTFAASGSETVDLVLSDTNYRLTAAPPSSTPFGERSATINPTTSTSPTVTLQYQKTVLAVTVKGGSGIPSGAAAGATVTLELASDSSAVSTPHVKDSATTTYYDLAVSTEYTASATYTSGGKTYSGTANKTTGTASATAVTLDVNLAVEP